MILLTANNKNTFHFFLYELYWPSCALQLSMVLSKFSWKRLLICLFGEVRTGVAPCFCWTVSLSSFRSISALLRSVTIRWHTTLNSSICTGEIIYLEQNHVEWRPVFVHRESTLFLFLFFCTFIIVKKGLPRLRLRMLPVGSVFSCLGMPTAWEWNGFGLSKELPAGPGRGWAGDAVQIFNV